MTTNTQINITAKDSTAGAFASASNNLSGLASSALKTTAGLAGIGLSIAGAVEAVKGISQATIQFQQFNSTLLVGTGSAKGAADALSFVRAESQRLGLDLATAADQFAKLSAASRGTSLEGKATRDIFTSVAQAAAVMGLSADQTSGSLLAIQQIISKGTVSAEELRGQLGERLPGAFQIAARAIGVTTAELDKLLRSGSVTAEQLLPALSKELDKTFGSQSEAAAQGLTAQMNRMNTAIFDLKIAIGESGLINFLSSGIELATKLAGALTSAFGGGQKLSPIEKQVSLIKTLEEELESLQNLTNIPLIGDLLFDKKQADLLKFRIESATEDLGKMKASFAADAVSETVISKAATQTEALSVATKRTISDAERFITALRKEAETVGLTAVEMKRLEAAKLGVSAAANPLISRIEKVTSEMDEQKESARALADDMRKIASITESVKTSEEKLIDTQTELDRLMKSGLGIETYNRALKKAQDETRGVTVATKSTTDEVGQLWIQAGRNIQSTLANSIFNFFDDGLKGMLKNVISTVGRIASEFAALKLAQGVGLASMFGAGNAVAGGGSILSGAANLGSSALNLFKVGGGISQGVSGLLGIGSSGTQAAAEAGATALWGTSGASASIGSSIASFAGPAIAVAAVDQIVRMLVGDKTLGGTAGKVLNFVPVLGPLINGLFGRGPIKQQGTLLEGQIGAEGFESGFLQTRFKAKGGAFRSDKIDFSRVDAVTGETFTDNGKLAGFTVELAEAGKQIFDSVNEATKQTTTALRGVASTLGLATGGIDNFNYSLSILTEKGEMIQGEQIAEEIAKISEGLAKSLLPGVEEFQRSGETALNTLVRLSGEFAVLTSAAGLLFDKSSQWSKDFVNQFSIGARSAFLEQAGGADAFAANAAGFAQNFFTEAEVMKPFLAALASARDEQGLSGLNTRQQVADAVRSGNLSAEQTLFLVSNQAAIDQAFDYLEKFNVAIEETADVAIKSAVAIFSIARDADSTEQGQRLNASINETAQAIAELEGIASQLSGTVNSINPLSTDQARAIVSNGNPYDPNLQNALSVLSTSDNNNFGSKLDLQRSNALNIGAINSLQNSVAANISAKQAQKSQFEFEKQMLQVALNNAASMFNVLAQTTKTAEILDRVTAGGGAVLVENVS